MTRLLHRNCLALPGALLVAGLLLAAGRPAAAAEPLSPEQEDQVRALIQDYLMENPEVLIESLRLYQEKAEAEAEAEARKAMAERREELERDPATPVLGNPEGDVTVVEFFDYRCPYCKKVAGDLLTLAERDGNIRLVMKEFPILGPDSVIAAKAALAAERQGKYEEMHEALMASKGKLDEAAILATAEEAGLDSEQLKADMQAPEIEEALARNHRLARALDIGGTPAFVIGDELYPGALDLEDLQQAVKAARAGAG